MKLKILACIGALTTLGLAPHASAAIGVVTYQGILDYGSTDPSDIFGGVLTPDEPITAVFDYNTALGVRTTTSTYDIVSGDYPFNTFPVTSATFTIGTYTYSFAPDYQADAETGQQLYDDDLNGLFNGVFDDAESISGDDAQVGIATDTAPPVSLDRSFASTGAGFGDLTTAGDSIDFDVLSMKVSATPEPATWMLMIAGVGLVGFALRRARRLAGGLLTV